MFSQLMLLRSFKVGRLNMRQGEKRHRKDQRIKVRHRKTQDLIHNSNLTQVANETHVVVHARILCYNSAATAEQCSNYREDGNSPHCGCEFHVIHGVEVSALSFSFFDNGK